MTNGKRILGVALAMAFGLAPAYASAQLPAPATASYSVMLLQNAQNLFIDGQARFVEAAAMLDQAGHAMPEDDATSADVLVWAARVAAYNGDLAEARDNMEEAAWRAMGNGKLMVAANAYADAALIALRQGDNAGAKELVRRVLVVANWKGLKYAERKQILDRIA